MKIGLLGGGFGTGTGPDTYARSLAEALGDRAAPVTADGLDVVHVVDAKRVSLHHLAHIRVPVALDFHDDYWTAPPGYPAPDLILRRWRRRQLRRHHLAALRFAASVIVHSRAVEQSLTREIAALRLPAPPRVCLVPLALPDAETVGKGKGADEASTGTAGSDGKPIILFVGRDLFRKGFPTLLAALPRVREKFPGARAVVVGREYRHTRLAARLMAGEQVEFLGHQDPAALAELYRRAAVVVLPSQQEAFGLTLLEAMAAGTPVVASRVGGIPEAVEDGVSGLLHRPGDAADLAEKILAVLSDPGLRSALVAGGRERVKTFNRPAMTAALDIAYAAAKTRAGCPCHQEWHGLPGRVPNSRLSRGKRLLFGAVAALLFLTAAETVLRLHDFGFYFNFGADLLGMPLLDLHSIRRVMNHTVEFDPVLFWRFKPNQKLTDSSIYRRPVTINSHGFRGPDFALPKPAGVYRVVCLGDSSTFGWSVADDETYPAQLAPLLQKRCPKRRVEVLNLGVTGYSSHQGRRLFERMAGQLRPDAVIFAFGPNDRLPALKSDRENEAARTWDIGPVSLFLSRFQLYKLLKSAVVYFQNREQGVSLDPKTYIPRLQRKVSPAEYADNVRAVKALCDRLGADLILIDVDYPSLPPDFIDREIKTQAAAAGAPMPPGWTAWDQAALVRSLGAELAVPTLDLREIFAVRLQDYAAGTVPLAPGQAAIAGADREPWHWLMIDNGHPNVYGHALIVDRLDAIIPGLPAYQKACEDKP